MHSRIQFLGPHYFAPRYFGARYFAVTFRPDAERIVAPGFQTRAVSAPASSGVAETDLQARAIAVRAESRSISILGENRRVVAEPVDREVS